MAAKSKYTVYVNTETQRRMGFSESDTVPPGWVLESEFQGDGAGKKTTRKKSSSKKSDDGDSKDDTPKEEKKTSFFGSGGSSFGGGE